MRFISLALRNAVRHVRHNVPLAGLFALTAVLFVTGNSVLLRSGHAVRELFVSSVTGDFLVAAAGDESMSVFGSNTPAIGEFVPIPRLPRHTEISAALAELPSVTAVTPLLSGYAVMDLAGWRGTVPFFGVETPGYFEVLHGVQLVSGRRLAPGERGAMLTVSQVDRLSRTGSVEIGDEVLLTTVRGRRFRIQGVPLVGIYRHVRPIQYLDEVVLVDLTTARALNDLQDRVHRDSAEVSGPRSPDEIDSLFGDSAGNSAEETQGERPGITPESVLDRLRSADGPDPAVGAGPAHFLLVSGALTGPAWELVDRYGARVLSWREGAGQSALLALLLQLVFNGGFALFTVAVLLAAVNIILLSTYRRTSEIATMRAMGARRAVVTRMLLSEHLLVGLIGWAVGTSGAYLIVRGVSFAGLARGNVLLEVLFATPVSRLHPFAVMASLLIVVVVVAMAVVVPVQVVLRSTIAQAVRET